MGERGQSLYFDYRSHPFETPPEMRGAQPLHAVLIVGGGPVGLACALELALYGVRSVVLEDDDMFATGSRAACISRRSMEILDQVGVVDDFLAKALPWTSGNSYYRGEVIFRLEMPHSDEERYYPMANLQQNYMEKMLHDRAVATGLVDVRWQSKVVGVEQGDEHVVVDVDTPEGRYRAIGSYLIVADGARSSVRDMMGLQLSGNSFSGHYLIADIKMKSESPTERRAWFDPPVNRDSTVLMHKQPDDIWRVDYQLREGDDPKRELQEPRIRERVQEVLDMAGETAPWELDWFSLYKAHCLCLERYDHGRILFVGDAAHLVPIFGVRGLNSGFADANNLGWKLAFVLAGWAPPALLETYTQERRGATLDTFDNAGKSAIFMTPPSRGYRLMRQAALSLALSEHWAAELANPRQSAPYDYADSALNSDASNEAAFAAGPRIGAPASCVSLAPDASAKPRYFTDLLHHEITLVLFHDGGPLRADLLEAIRALQREPVPFRTVIVSSSGDTMDEDIEAEIVTDRDRHVFAAYGARHGTGYVLRPDWHVAARMHELGGQDLRAAVARILMKGRA